MKLTLTRDQMYSRKQRVWRAWCEWYGRLIRAFFPDTGGVELFMHNWYCCAEKSNPSGARLADWVKESGWGRLRRIEARLEAHDEIREHLTHSRNFRPLWCAYCQGRKHL